MDCGGLVSPPAPFGLMDQGMMTEGLNVLVSIFACLCAARTSVLVCIFALKCASLHVWKNDWDDLEWELVGGHGVNFRSPQLPPSKHTSTLTASNNNHECPVQVGFSPPLSNWRVSLCIFYRLLIKYFLELNSGSYGHYGLVWHIAIFQWPKWLFP